MLKPNMPTERLLDRLMFYARSGSYPETHPAMQELYLAILRRCEAQQAVAEVAADFRRVLAGGR